MVMRTFPLFFDLETLNSPHLFKNNYKTRYNDNNLVLQTPVTQTITKIIL
jgi:hypothetical protein